MVSNPFHLFDKINSSVHSSAFVSRKSNRKQRHHTTIAYLESAVFSDQFCTERRRAGPITARSRFCLGSTTPSASDKLDRYLKERAHMIDIFNINLTKRLRADPYLSLDSFKLVRELGEGGYGAVFLAFHPDTNEFVALKAINKATLVETDEQNTVVFERQYAFALCHPNIVQLVTSFKDNEYVYLVLEWLQGGDLYSLMTCQKLTEVQAQFYSAQILMALDYLHGCKVVFRDLKPDNVVLTRRGYIKLVDLGLAKIIRGFSNTFCGTPHYIAPEIIMHRPYTVSPDYWTLGIMIHEMVTGDAPYDRTVKMHSDSSENSVLFKDSTRRNKTVTSMPGQDRSLSTIETDTSGIIRPSSRHYNMYLRIVNGCSTINLQNVTPQCASLIHHLLQHNITQRLGCGPRGALDVFEHAWFAQIDFWHLYRQHYVAPFIPIRKHVIPHKHKDEAVLKLSATNNYENEFAEF